MNVWIKHSSDNPLIKGVYVGSEFPQERIRDNIFILYDVKVENELSMIETIDAIRSIKTNVVFCLPYSEKNLILLYQLNKNHEFLTAIRLTSSDIFEANQILDAGFDFIVVENKSIDFISLLRQIRDKNLIKTRIVYDFKEKIPEIVSLVDIGIIND